MQLSDTPLNRAGIFGRFPWLRERGQPMIISTDLDGLLSAALLHHSLGWSVAGYYNGVSLWLTETARVKREQLVWVNAEPCTGTTRSVGCGRLAPSGPVPPIPSRACNPNLLAGCWNNSERYPFSTILFLLWLHAVPVRRDLIARLLLLHTASVWEQRIKQRERCLAWETQLSDWGWVWLFQGVDTELFQRRLREELFTRLAGRGVASESGQLRFDPDWDEDLILRVYNLAGTYLKWSPPKVPGISDRLTGQSGIISPAEFSGVDLPAEMARQGVFSYAIERSGTVNFTKLEW